MARSPLQYAKVACKVHQDPEFRRLPRDTRLLWMTLLTTEHAQNNPPGLWRASDLMMLDDLADFTQEELDKHRRVLEKAGMLQYDAECRIWWRVKSVRAEYNTPDTWQAAVSWARKLAGFERCPLIVEYILAIVSQVDRWPKRAREAFVPALQSCGVDPATIAVDERYLDSPTCRALHPMGDGSKKHGGSVSGNLFRVSEGYAYGNGTVTLPSAGAGAGAGAGSVRSGSSDRDREIVKDPGSTEPGGNGKKPKKGGKRAKKAKKPKAIREAKLGAGAYQAFVSEQMKAGKTLGEAAKAWHDKKAGS